LILCDGATLTAPKGVDIGVLGTLNVYCQREGTGKLVAIGSGGFGALGGNNFALTINGGVIEARGSYQQAGIGGRSCSVTINGGVVTATGGNGAAGIGTGSRGDWCNVTINGGVVTATGGGDCGAGIGGGEGSSAAAITINGGVVTATATGFSSGIGGGGTDYGRYTPGEGGTVVINGGQITARSYPNGRDDRAYAIGPGCYNSRHRHGSPTVLTVNLTNEDDFLDADTVCVTGVTIGSPLRYTWEDEDLGVVTTESLAENNIEGVMRPGRSGAGIRISEGDVSLIYGEEPFTLTGVVTTPGNDGVWTWESSDPCVADIAGYDRGAVVRAVGVGCAEVTAHYGSDIMDGSATVTVTVDKGYDKALPEVIRCAETTDRSFSVDLSGIVPYDAGQITDWSVTGEPVCTGGVRASDIAVGNTDGSDPGVVTGEFSGGQDGDTILIPVKVTAGNYDCYVDVIVSLIYTAPVEHDVDIAYRGPDGTVSVDRLTAVAGETVIVSALPDLGCTLDSVTVTDGDDNEITVEDGQFIMPDSDVSVTAGFTRNYSYDRTTKALTLVRGDYGKYDKWSVEIYPTDVLSVAAEDGVRFVGDCSDLFLNFNHCVSFDLDAVDTSGATNMSFMFCGCTAMEELDVTGWDTSSVTNMFSMFAFCKSVRELDLEGFVTSSVTKMNSMFNGCISLETVDLAGWDTSSAKGMSNLFFECESLRSVDFASLDTSSVEEMMDTFTLCRSLTDISLDGLDLSHVQYMTGMFEGCESLTSLDLSGLDIPEVLYIDCMFADCTSLESIDLSGWNTPSLQSMEEVFRNCTSLTTIDLSDLDTDDVWSLNGLFRGCTALEDVDLDGLVTSSVCDTAKMFEECSSLTSLDLSWLDTASLGNTNGMFSGCSGLTELTVPTLGSGLWDISNMFAGCTSLESIALSAVETEYGVCCEGLFAGCTGLGCVDLSGFGATLDYPVYMFEGCGALETLNVPAGFEVTEEACLNNKDEDYAGWAVEGTNEIVSGDGEYAVIAPAASATTFVRTAAVQVLRGDANGDGKFNSKDLSLLKRIVAGTAEDGTYNAANADVNGDGKYTNKDVSALKRIIAQG
ncbi:MAG: BspA family leucine-rich repeat surface protein, partial [Clostridia bacterium]|nr:BspA family leucine-rich repeat surface protein [Clostridia bacterium]